MVDSTPPGSRGRRGQGLLRDRVAQLEAENAQLREQLDAITLALAGSMDQLVEGIGPLRNLEALVPERARMPLEPVQAALLEGLQEALERPDFGTRAGLKTIPEPPRRKGGFEQGPEAAR